MTAQQPEARALYLARELEAGSFMPNILQNENGLRINSAAELRRLHEVNFELLETLRNISECSTDAGAIACARAAIAYATGE